MGDVIEIIDSLTIQSQIRMKDGAKIEYEICIIYPDAMDKDNVTLNYGHHEDEMQLDFERIMHDVNETLVAI
jgi:hypothetical protein